MIITAGDLKGKNIICPAGKEIRPTSSKIRQAIFNVLYSMDVNLNNTKFLELFSGTGIVSFEAISRGSDTATLVDSSVNAVALSKQNVHNLKLDQKVTIIKQDSVEFVKTRELKSFDLVFIDPP
ncbi:MAG: RsmD family RNA methyltransferase, partial [bacterium]